MTGSSPRVGEQRPGGRAARVRSDVIDATTALLMEVGYESLTIEDVAKQAGVHKTTIYRRWATKSELVTDAVRTHSDRNVPIPNTGSLGDDLCEFAKEVAANIGSAGGSLRSKSIVAASTISDSLEAEMHGLWAERLALSATIVERAIARGELPPDSDPNLIIEALIGPLWVRLLLTGEPITDELAERTAALVTAGAVALAHV